MARFSRRILLAAPLPLLAGCRAASLVDDGSPGLLPGGTRGVRLRAGHDNPPGHPVQEGLAHAARSLAEATRGRLELQVFPSSQLGTQQEQLLATVVGSQDLYLTGDIWLAQYYPPIGVLESPYVFRDTAHMYRALESPIALRLLDGLRERVGVRVLDHWYLGRRHLTLVRAPGGQPARRPEDLRGMKVRSPGPPIYQETVRALGAHPDPKGIAEVYLALKTGDIDGQENPLPTIDSFKFQEVARYLVLTGHMITPLALVMNDRRWSRLAEADREAVLLALRAGRELSNRLVTEQEGALLRKFRAEGVTVVEPDVDAFRAAAAAVVRKFEGVWGAGVYEALAALGEEKA